ncbi:class I SAM-dependent DNA methyltransferase [Chloroflexota bacterium]
MSFTTSSAYYTPQPLAELLVSMVPLRRVQRVLDLCVGSGNLLAAARSKWPSTKLVGVDIEQGAITECRKRFSEQAIFLQGDATVLEADFGSCVYDDLVSRTYDVVLANPPFVKANSNRQIAPDLSSCNGIELPQHWDLLSRRTEAVCLVHNVLRVRDGGYLAAIVPNGILSCDRFLSLRKWLLAQTNHVTIVRLPQRAFANTEVSAAALVLRKTPKLHPNTSCRLTLQEATTSGNRFARKTLYEGDINGPTFRLDTGQLSYQVRWPQPWQQPRRALGRHVSFVKRGGSYSQNTFRQ